MTREQVAAVVADAARLCEAHARRDHSAEYATQNELQSLAQLRWILDSFSRDEKVA